MTATAPTSIAALLGTDVLAALARLEVQAVDAVSITGLPATRNTRATYRIGLSDGRVVKARRLQRTARAARFARIVQGLSHECIPPPLVVMGRVSVEAWVEGTPVSALPPSAERLAQAADLLGSLHARRAADGRPGTLWSTRLFRASTERRLAGLEARGLLAPGEVAAALTAVGRLAPEVAEVGLTHNDFCAENLVAEAGGRLVAVDNEGLRRGFLDYDLARTWYRWPMPEPDWRAFSTRYASWRLHPIDVQPLHFWRIAAVAKSAALRAQHRAADAHLPIERLRLLLAGL
jgi:hypothetical protein